MLKRNLQSPTFFAIVQQSPDINFHQLTEEDTSKQPTTSTLKRNQQHLCNNNQYCLKTKNPLNLPYEPIISPSTCSIVIGNTGANSSDLSENEKPSDVTHILRNDTMIGSERNSTKFRNLTLSTDNRSGHPNVYATDVDLVGSSRGASRGAAYIDHPPADRRHTMGATSHGGNHQHHGIESTFSDAINYHLGLVGWRKKCLYILLLLLILLIAINLILTLWIIRVMEFSMVSSNCFFFLKKF